MPDLDLRMVRYFVAVAHEGSFTRAAASLGISQPALSQQIKRFEELIGVILIERSSAGPVLTAAGEAMLREGERLLAAGEQAVRWTQETAPSVAADRVRLGFVQGTPAPLVTLALRVIDRFADTTKLELNSIEWLDQMVCLVSGSVDIAFVEMPLTVEGLSVNALAAVPMVAALPLRHRLARRRRLRMSDLAGEPIVDAVYNRDFWIGNPRPDGSTPNVVEPAAVTAEEMLALVASGRAMALTTGSLADAHPRRDVSFVPITDLAPLSYGVAWRTSESRPLIHLLVDTICAELQAEAGGSPDRVCDAPHRPSKRRPPGEG